MSTMASKIRLETFQASDFNVSALVESLMDEDVRKSKEKGGGELIDPATDTRSPSKSLTRC